MKVHHISTKKLSIEDIKEILQENKRIELSADAVTKVEKCRSFLDDKLARHDKPIYGINTGFGSLHDRSISEENLEQLQVNLVKSHACGMGDEVPEVIVQIMLLLKTQGLSYGHSGVQLKTIQRLVDMYNNGVHPIVYQLGSLGASGDLSPLAHMSLPLLGLGKIRINGELHTGEEVLRKFNFDKINLKSKEGLALLNGTQFMSSYGCWLLIEAEKIMRWADLIGSISLEAYDGRIEPFGDSIHIVRNHPGQLSTARAIRSHVYGSEIITQEKKHVQDPYSFRCMPQVHGATKDVVAFIKEVFEREINAVTDNPTIFPDEDLIVSAGNFHGQPLALALDQLSIAISELGSISERRTYKLISGNRGLPPFLVANPGLNSGFMIPQYTAASIVSQNKALCTPNSVDTIDSSNGQEDHVSMGANAATKAYRVIENVKRIFAIELMNAVQALEFRRPLKSSQEIENLVSDYRKQVSRVEDDVIMHDLMAKSLEFLENRG